MYKKKIISKPLGICPSGPSKNKYNKSIPIPYIPIPSPKPSPKPIKSFILFDLLNLFNFLI